MKKILLITTLITFATSGSVLAAALGQDTVSNTGLQIYGGVNATDATTGVLLGKMSKGVKFRSRYTTSGFAAATYNPSGSKTYGTGHNSTAIYFKDIGSNAADGTWSLSDASNTSFGTAWTTM